VEYEYLSIRYPLTVMSHWVVRRREKQVLKLQVPAVFVKWQE